jgi:hypothetical protein
LAKLKADWQRGPMTYAAYAHYVDAMEADWDFVFTRQGSPVARMEDLAGSRVGVLRDRGLCYPPETPTLHGKSSTHH